MPADAVIRAAQAAALERWDRPFPGFTSGHDPRTSDQALLTLFYGGLEHAARYDWLNAGRRLIDKTYVDMLWHVQDLTNMRTCRAEPIAAALDAFIGDTIKPVWASLADLSHAQRFATATRWVEQMAARAFGSVHSEVAASRLMFYLLPMLPVFNLSRGHQLALARIGHEPADNSYAGYAQAAGAAYRALAPTLSALPRPQAHFGDTDQQAVIQRMLDDSDWWARRVFDEMLRQGVPRDQAAGPGLFACDDAGQLVN